LLVQAADFNELWLLPVKEPCTENAAIVPDSGTDIAQMKSVAICQLINHSLLVTCVAAQLEALR